MVSTQIYEGFSISHAGILSSSSSAEAQQIYGVRNGTVATDNGNFDNTGDDTVLSEWFWMNFANLTIEEGYIPMPMVALITGTTISSSGAAPNDYYSMPLWTLSALQQVTRSVALRVPSKDSSGSLYTLDFVLYRVQFQPFNFTGPSYKNGLTFSVNGRALFSAVDELGNALPATYPKSIGRLIAAPGVQTGAFSGLPFQGT